LHQVAVRPLYAQVSSVQKPLQFIQLNQSFNYQLSCHQKKPSTKLQNK